jgi:glucose-1-phosphate cytidylyltransferase
MENKLLSQKLTQYQQVCGENMEVVILCGGLGTRLKEETEFRPKPMVKIGTRPILWHIMKMYSTFGLKDFILALGYKGEMIKEYFYHYEFMDSDVTIELGHPEKTCVYHNGIRENDWKITLANTGENSLKGSRIKKIEKYITGNEFMMTYGDGVSNIDISQLLEFHHRHGKIATVTGIHAAARFGELKIDGDCVEKFNEKPASGSEFINGGFFVFNRKIFDYLTPDDNCDFEVGPLERLAEMGELMVYKHQGSWACMDTLRDTEYLNKLWNENKAFWKNWQ